MGGDASPHTHWLATTRPDGGPHVMPIGVTWLDGRFYFSSGPGTRKAKNLAQNPHCVITLAGQGLDLVLEGEAVKVTDEAKLHRLADVFASAGWAPTVRDGAFYHEFSAPSAGPPPRPGPSSAWRPPSRTARRAGACSRPRTTRGIHAGGPGRRS